MASSSVVSPSSSVFSSPILNTSQSSVTFYSSPSGDYSRFLHLNHSFIDEDSDEEDLERIDPRVGPSTPRKKKKSLRTIATPSPSKFVIKGTVTPSRAAPLFARFTAIRRSAKRSTSKRGFSSEDSDDDETSGLKSNRSLSAGGYFRSASREQEHTSQVKTQHAEFINPSRSRHALPTTNVPVLNSVRPRAGTENTAAYLLSIRSNALHHMHYARSALGTHGGSSGRGILGVSRMLGAGGGQSSVSQLSFHQTFHTRSRPEEDLFTLPSIHGEPDMAQPLCADYAFSSRSLNNHQAQWLAVGDNEGRVHLINTLSDPMASFNTEVINKPRWSACRGSVFELKWRYDDEMLAAGGSDYIVRVWSPETGEELRAFKGHRGSPRTIAWDPHSSGSILASGGRDGAVHLYDLRIKEGSWNGEPWSPCLSLWEAHTIEETPRPLRGPGSRGGARNKTSLKQPKAVTSIAFLPGRGANLLATAGCVDGKVKLWDLRQLRTESAAEGVKDFGGTKRKLTKDDDIALFDPLDQGIDVTRQLLSRLQSNRSTHGISNIVVGPDKLFAACTDGRIYTVNCADFLQTGTTQTGHVAPPLYHDVQRGNTLYARMALHDDNRTLALGCNTGVVTVWDTHAASLSLGEINSGSCTYTGEAEPDSCNLDVLCGMARPAILRSGHTTNFEVNCVSWAHGPKGPTLASVSDDYTIRTWHSTPRQDNMSRHEYQDWQDEDY